MTAITRNEIEGMIERCEKCVGEGERQKTKGPVSRWFHSDTQKQCECTVSTKLQVVNIMLGCCYYCCCCESPISFPSILQTEQVAI